MRFFSRFSEWYFLRDQRPLGPEILPEPSGFTSTDDTDPASPRTSVSDSPSLHVVPD